MRPGAASIGTSRGVRHRIAEKHNFTPRHATTYGSNQHHYSHKKKRNNDDDSSGFGERFTETMSSISKWFSNQFSKLKKKKEDNTNEN
jgi:hypothetical protein